MARNVQTRDGRMLVKGREVMTGDMLLSAVDRT